MQTILKKHRHRGASFRESWDDKLFDFIVNALIIAATLLVLYPLYFIILASVSEPSAVQQGKVLISTPSISLSGYKHILGDTRIWVGYRNTILYTVVGTSIGVFTTILGAYSLSRKDLVGGKVIMKLLVFTMFFSGGLVPTYMVVKDLGMVNTPYVLMILGSFSVYNLIIARTFFSTKIPTELLEAARIDGCANGRFFVQIVLPLSKEIVAVILLFYAVGHWNSYFNALIYISKPSLYPLQLVLRDILMAAESVAPTGADLEAVIEMQRLSEIIKYGVILVSSLPILILYPFLQRFFIRGIMIGSIKG